MSEENAALSEACALIGREALSNVQQGDGAQALANYPYKGQAVITIFLLGAGKVQVTAEFDKGDKLRYEASVFGVLAGAGGISFGGGAFDLSPSELLNGPMGCALTLGLPGVAIAFLRDARVIGSFFGAGPNVGVGTGGGSGEWKRI